MKILKLINSGIYYSPEYWETVCSTRISQPGFKRQIEFGLGKRREKDFLGCHADCGKIIVERTSVLWKYSSGTSMWNCFLWGSE